MPRARRGRRRKDNNSPVTREEFNSLWDMVALIEQRSLAGRGITPVEGGGAGGDDGYVITWPGAGNTPVRPSDGVAPGSSPTPEVEGGYGFFAVKWASVDNPDTVTYQVHVSASSGFTPGPSTLAGSHAGTLAFIKNLPNGDPFLAATTYYFKLVAMDVDGEAAAGGEDSAQLVAVPSSSVGTDGGTPGKPDVTLRSGPGWIQASWPSVGGTVDPVGYWVYMSTSSGFTPGAGNFIAQTEGNTIVLNKLTAGTQLQTGTTYYVKVIAASLLSGNVSAASDEDSSSPAVIDNTVTTISNLDAGTIVTGTLDAARIATGSLDGDKITANTITSDEIAADAITTTELAADAVIAENILAGEVRADKMEAVMEMVTSMIAGSFGGANVQVGYGTVDDGAGNPIVDTSFIGVRAYDGSVTDPVFKLPADGSPAVFRGVVKFGSQAKSKLLQNDMIQVQEQSTDAFANPQIVQSVTSAGYDLSSPEVEFESDVVVGNCLILVMSSWDGGGNAIHTTPSGWTSLQGGNTWDDGDGRFQVWGKIATGSGDGSPGDPVVISCDKAVDFFTFQFFEFSGTTLTEHVPSDNDTDDTANPTMTVPTSSAISQRCLVLGVAGAGGNYIPHSISRPGLNYDPVLAAGWDIIGNSLQTSNGVSLSGDAQHIETFMQVQDSGTVAFSIPTNVDADAGYAAQIILEAKAQSVESSDADTARLYAQEISSVAYLHSQDENGRESAIVLGKAGEVWRMETAVVSVNIPSTAAKSGGVLNLTAGVPSFSAGAIIVFLGADSSTARGFTSRPRSPAPNANQIDLDYFNCDSTATQDPASFDGLFLIIHRS